jgi:TBC1 domain family member 20
VRCVLLCITAHLSPLALCIYSDGIRRRAWPKLVGLHEVWGDEDQQATPLQAHLQANLVTPTKDVRRKSRRPLVLPKSAPGTPDDDDASTTSHLSTQSNISAYKSPTKIVPSLDSRQIDLDVARCTWHLLTGTQRIRRLQMEHKRHRKVARLIRRKQRRLGNLINYALVQTYSLTDPERLRYYQGYHDVACIFLSVLGGHHHQRSQSFMHNSTSSIHSASVANDLQVPAAVLGRVSLAHLRDCLRPNFSHLQVALRLTIFPLIALIDPEVHEHLFNCEMEPFFALSWVITWFAHEIRDTDLVKRLFDTFLVSHPLFPIYLSIAMVCHKFNREEILQTECDFALIHQTLRGLPKNSSMVGWKYRPGDGYVSDDEEDGTVSTDTMDSQSLEGDALLIQANLAEAEDLDPDQGEQRSLITNSLSSFLEPPVRVPYQDLIDTAIAYMRRVPPRHLLQLACRYYGKENVEQILMEEAGEVSLLANPPSWTRIARTPADWVLRKHRQEQTPRRGRKPRSRSLTSATPMQLLEDNQDTSSVLVPGLSREMTERILHARLDSRAAIAAGFGIGIEEERRLKRRKKAVLAALMLVILSSSLGLVMHVYKDAITSQMKPEPARIMRDKTKVHPEGTVSKHKGTPSGKPVRQMESARQMEMQRTDSKRNMEMNHRMTRETESEMKSGLDKQEPVESSKDDKDAVDMAVNDKKGWDRSPPSSGDPDDAATEAETDYSDSEGCVSSEE